MENSREALEQEKEEKQYRKMTETPVSSLIVSLGIPTIISMLITNIYNMADTYFVSKIGTSASGAVGIVYSLMAILQAFGFMFGHGAGSIISRKLGQKDKESATRFASTSFYLSFAVGLVIMIFGLAFLSPFMRFLGSTETILPYARQYGFWILVAGPFMASSCVLNNILRYEGQAAYAMIGLTAGGILNMIGDPILMFTFHMGVYGAGLSTALSQIISFLLLLWMFVAGKTQSKLRISRITRSGREIWQIITTGFPSMVRQGMGSIAGMLLNHAAAVYGDAAVAAMSIVNRVSMFVFSVGLGIGQGFQPVAAFNYGAGRYSRVRDGFWFTVICSEIFLGLLAVVVFLLSGQVIGWFRNDPDVIAVGTLALRCQCAACLFQPLSISTNMMLQSVGKSGRAAILSALRSGVFFFPLILILPRVWGLLGVQTAQSIADVLTFAVTVPMMIGFLHEMPKTDARNMPEKTVKAADRP